MGCILVDWLNFMFHQRVYLPVSKLQGFIDDVLLGGAPRGGAR